MHNHYTTEDRKDQLHIVMLSPSTGGSTLRKHGDRGRIDKRLYLYVNRPFGEVMDSPVLFAHLFESIPGIRRSGFGVISVDAFCHMAPDDTVVPQEDDGIVLRLKLKRDVENPTMVIASLAQTLSATFGVDLANTMLSGKYEQDEPESYAALSMHEFPAQYLDVHAFTALSQRVLVAA